MPWLLICSAEVSQESRRWKPVFVAAALGWAWQQALISTVTFLPEREFLPTENCHSGELCTGGLIVGCECGAAWHPLHCSSYCYCYCCCCCCCLHFTCLNPLLGLPCILFLFVFSQNRAFGFLVVFGISHLFRCSLPAPHLHLSPHQLWRCLPPTSSILAAEKLNQTQLVL